MNHIKSFLISYLLPAAAVALVACGYVQAGSSDMQLCKHQYALCTSAKCIPQPGEPTKAICLCDVEEGASMSTTACDQLKPSTDANGIRTVYSTFSFAQFQSKQSMKCPEGTPWTWCLNKRCTVAPDNSKKAICVCDVVRTGGEWTTLGGNCDTSTCATGYWSGATIKAYGEGNAFLVKALGLKDSPSKWCPVSS